MGLLLGVGWEALAPPGTRISRNGGFQVLVGVGGMSLGRDQRSGRTLRDAIAAEINGPEWSGG